MYIVQRSLRFIRGAVLSYGPSYIKKSFWDKEYSTEKWNFNDNTATDCVYLYLAKYANKGSILDLGCGSGNTSNELASTAYASYLGVDISEAALRKARRRTEESGRANKNRFIPGELIKYEPDQQFDVILFRESLYHVPLGKVKTVLDRYSNFLKRHGVFIVRLFTSENGRVKHRPSAMTAIIEGAFDVVERSDCESGASILVFRPNRIDKD
jgi:2-polyprenyl-3-methyl-5-hydroxy-6-metoxy-1,4-benzoquinol methylase